MRFLPPSVRAGIAATVLLGTLVDAGQAAPSTGSSRRLPTPALIERGVDQGRTSRARGYLYLAYAFGRPSKLPAIYRSDAPWDGTLPLLELQRALATMPPGAERNEIAEIVGESAGPGSCGSSNQPLPDPETTPHFYIEYDDGTLGGGLSIADYVASLEASWDREVTSFGWAAPPVAPIPAPGGKYHVRIDQLSPGMYGFVTNVGTHAGMVFNNPNTSWDDVDAFASCMVLRDNYSGFPSSPQASLDATTAHEFNHSLQFGYGALHGSNRPDVVFIEGGAAWMEDEVFDDSNDNQHFLWPVFTESMGDHDAGLFPYQYWVTFRGLTERYGTGTPGGAEQVMQDFWEETSRNTGDNLSALQTALANRGTNLADAYHAYAIAVKFNKPCTGGYAYPHCLEEGPDYVARRGPTPVHGSIPAVGAAFDGSLEDNYSLNWVQLPTGSGAYPVRLLNTSAGGQLRASVVCETGGGLRVTPLPAVVGAGVSTAIPELDPGGCVSVVAVITNQAQTHPNPPSSESRSYRLMTAPPPAAPQITGDAFSRPFQTSKEISMGWGTAAGVTYDVRYRSAPYGGDFGGFVSWRTGTADAGGVFIAQPGRTYCFSARATNAELNTSEFGDERCTAIPVDNPSLRHHGRWAKKRGSGYFLGTFSMTSVPGSSVVLSGVRAKRLAVVVTKCRRCGTIKVFFGSKLLRTVRLGASGVRKKRVVNIATFDAVRLGRLRAVVATSGRPVKIEGVGASRV